MKRRQISLLWLGLCLLALWAVPHPHEGVYWFRLENGGSTSGGFPEITLLRRCLWAVAGLSVADFIAKPFYVRWRWRKWFPLGM